MTLIPNSLNAEISPIEFELLVKEFLDGVGKKLKNFKTKHDVTMQKSDGNYQIDIYAEFEELGVGFKILVECKRYKNSIKRETVQLLFDKIRATGAHKGIIFSTSDFQSGALRFAEEHGIALIRIIEGKYTYKTKSNNSQNFEPPPWARMPKYVGEFKQKNSTTYLQDGYYESLGNFLFDI